MKKQMSIGMSMSMVCPFNLYYFLNVFYPKQLGKVRAIKLVF